MLHWHEATALVCAVTVVTGHLIGQSSRHPRCHITCLVAVIYKVYDIPRSRDPVGCTFHMSFYIVLCIHAPRLRTKCVANYLFWLGILWIENPDRLSHPVRMPREYFFKGWCWVCNKKTSHLKWECTSVWKGKTRTTFSSSGNTLI